MMTTSVEGTDLRKRLCMAARDGLVEDIRALVKEGADVVQQDAQGLTALHYAARYGKVETVRVILELGGYAHATRFVATERHTEPPSRVMVELRDHARAKFGLALRYIVLLVLGEWKL